MSPQQLTDCPNPAIGGCNDGGHPINAYDYILQNGIIADSYYPFKGAQVSNILINLFETLY